MKTEQASIFGVPNTIFGLMGFSALTVFGITLLAGATFRKWLWQVISIGVLVGFCFFIYLFFEGVYRIHEICSYCFVIWMIMPPILWYTSLYNIGEGNVKSKFIHVRIKTWLRQHHVDVLIIWYLLIFTLLLTHFWYYWKTTF